VGFIAGVGRATKPSRGVGFVAYIAGVVGPCDASQRSRAPDACDEMLAIGDKPRTNTCAVRECDEMLAIGDKRRTNTCAVRECDEMLAIGDKRRTNTCAVRECDEMLAIGDKRRTHRRWCDACDEMHPAAGAPTLTEQAVDVRRPHNRVRDDT